MNKKIYIMNPEVGLGRNQKMFMKCVNVSWFLIILASLKSLDSGHLNDTKIRDILTPFADHFFDLQRFRFSLVNRIQFDGENASLKLLFIDFNLSTCSIAALDECRIKTRLRIDLINRFWFRLNAGIESFLTTPKTVQYMF